MAIKGRIQRNIFECPNDVWGESNGALGRVKLPKEVYSFHAIRGVMLVMLCVVLPHEC